MKPFHFLALGADPEVFLVDNDGNPLSVEGLLGGTKNEPKPMSNKKDGFFIQEDCVAAEYNIPPAESAKQFGHNIIAGLTYIHKQVNKKVKCYVRCISALDFPEEQLKTIQAQTFGCDPDFSAWTEEVNPPKEPPKFMRTAAGHIHVSWKNPENDQAYALVKALDVYLGLPSVIAFPPTKRRELYGKAGCFRPKVYGVEYRVLGNEWLAVHKHCEYVFNTVAQTMNRLNKHADALMDDIEIYGEDIQNAINNNNRDLSASLMGKFEALPFPNVN